MKRIKDLFRKQVAGVFKSILSGKKFQPMPSYWALIPVKHDDRNISKIMQENRQTNNPADNINLN